MTNGQPIHGRHLANRINRAQVMADIARRLGADREIAAGWTDDEWNVIDHAYFDRSKLKKFHPSSLATRRACMVMLPKPQNAVVAIPDDPFAGLV